MGYGNEHRVILILLIKYSQCLILTSKDQIKDDLLYGQKIAQWHAIFYIHVIRILGKFKSIKHPHTVFLFNSIGYTNKPKRSRSRGKDTSAKMTQ